MGKRGPRPKFVDVACPNNKCNQFGIKGQGNIIGNGTYPTRSGRIRKYICISCRTVFCERTNTVFYDLRTGEDTVLLALKMLLNGMSPSIHSPDFRDQPRYGQKVACPSG